MKNLVFLLVLFPFFELAAYEKADAFVIKIFDNRYKVLAPALFKKDLNVIIENKTMVSIVGKLQTLRGRVLQIIQLEEKSFKSIKLDIKKHERIFFVPLSPPAQEVELIIGRRSYEIPPQR